MSTGMVEGVAGPQVAELLGLLPGGLGEHLRAAALLSWAQAGLPEAVGFLDRAEMLFRCAGREEEASATRRLRVLLHAEMQEGDEALRLYTATGAAAVGDRPWLSARVALTAAFCFADRGGDGDEAAARLALAEGRSLAEGIVDEAERLHLDWLAARALARLTGGLTGNLALVSLRFRFIAWFPWLDQFLLTLDIHACRTPAGHVLDLAAVLKEAERFAGIHEGHCCVDQALTFTRTLVPGPTPWKAGGFAGLLLRNFFRRDGHTVRPLPFLMPSQGLGPVPRATRFQSPDL